MRISDRYLAFEQKVIIAVTNNEKARLLCALGREVDEIEIIDIRDIAAPECELSKHEQGQTDFDAIKLERLKALYTSLCERLKTMLEHEDYAKAIVCVPEVNKNFIAEHLTREMNNKNTEIIPKNLASMDISQIVRILLEG